MAQQNIVITGEGIVSAIGVGKDAVAQSLRDRRTGIGPMRWLGARHTELPVGEVKLSDDEMKVIENMSRMIVRKLLRFPMMEINASAGTEREKFYIDAMNKLFKLDFIEEDAESEAEANYRYAQQ